VKIKLTQKGVVQYTFCKCVNKAARPVTNHDRLNVYLVKQAKQNMLGLNKLYIDLALSKLI